MHTVEVADSSTPLRSAQNDSALMASDLEVTHDVFEYIEGWYNPHRRHSALKYQSPVTYEKLMAMGDEVETYTLSTKAG